ncbi:hypothetical protein GGI1_11763 [Acidithiobacillus sp. GGI-221]|nr:hypothetical protein GGI1_11763 [Acidithiobacillus sp. GGI-221]
MAAPVVAAVVKSDDAEPVLLVVAAVAAFPRAERVDATAEDTGLGRTFSLGALPAPASSTEGEEEDAPP